MSVGRIYLIGSGSVYAVKVGFTTGNPRNRLKALQTGSPDKLYMLGSIPGTMEQEKALHVRFDRQRMTGEWFRVEGEFERWLLEVMDLEAEPA